MEKLLSISDLRVNFMSLRGIVKALDGVDLSVQKGEIVGLVGESGCGKTITGFSVLGLLPKSQAEIVSGAIEFEDENLLGRSDAQMRSIRGRAISMVFQDPLASLNPVFTIGDQISRIVRIHTGASKKEAIDVTREALASTGLPSGATILGSYPHQLSGGMRQRACMAMAISCGSRLLIADEPTTALDVTIQMQMLRLLLRLRDDLGVSQLLITHNVGVAAQTCDRVAVMYAGTIVEEGPVTEVIKHARHPYSTALYECLPGGERADELQTIPGSVPDLISPPSGCRYHPRCTRVMDRCHTEKPDSISLSDHHRVACHWVSEQVGTTRKGTS